MKLGPQPLINMECSSTIDQQGMKLEQYLLINREWSYNKTIDQQGMKLEKQLLINMEWSSNKNYWSTGNEVKKVVVTKTIDQRVGSYQQLLINREWS